TSSSGGSTFFNIDASGVAHFLNTIAGNINGNAGTATALQNARTINGVSFDGTANVTVPAAASTLTGSSLASGVTGSSLTGVGALTSGSIATGFGSISTANNIATTGSGTITAAGGFSGNVTGNV